MQARMAIAHAPSNGDVAYKRQLTKKILTFGHHRYNQGINDAAGVCETVAGRVNLDTPHRPDETTWYMSAEECADAIRKLKEPKDAQ